MKRITGHCVGATPDCAGVAVEPEEPAEPLPVLAGVFGVGELCDELFRRALPSGANGFGRPTGAGESATPKSRRLLKTGTLQTLSSSDIE